MNAAASLKQSCGLSGRRWQAIFRGMNAAASLKRQTGQFALVAPVIDHDGNF
jgi:hypothetical protein